VKKKKTCNSTNQCRSWFRQWLIEFVRCYGWKKF